MVKEKTTGQTQAQAVEELTLVTQEQQDMVKEKKTGQTQEQALEEATPVKQGSHRIETVI